MSQLPWFVARASGLVGWALVSASVVWGLTLSGKPFGRRPHPAWLLDLHRYLGGLATIFTLVHVAAVIADSYVHFTLASALVPFMSAWKPIAIAWGIVGLYLLVAIELTSLARRHLPKRAWRAVHFASFPLFVVATIHGLTAGEDTTSNLALLVVVLVSALVGALTILRIRGAKSRPPRAEYQTVPKVNRSTVTARPRDAVRSARPG